MQGERSERVVDLSGVAHELREIALALPYGWGVLLEADGQVRILPPDIGNLGTGDGDLKARFQVTNRQRR